MQKPEEELELGLALTAFLLPGSGKPVCQLEFAYCRGLLAGKLHLGLGFLDILFYFEDRVLCIPGYLKCSRR